MSGKNTAILLKLRLPETDISSARTFLQADSSPDKADETQLSCRNIQKNHRQTTQIT